MLSQRKRKAKSEFMSKTIGQVLEDLKLLKTKEEANRYLFKALQENSNAWSNIKYITGYLGNEERNRILNMFDAD